MNYAWAQTGAKVGVKAGVWDAVASASLPVQLLLLLLIVLSVICWGIIFSKYKQYQELSEANQSFSDKFWKATSLEAVFKSLDQHPLSNIARVFGSGYQELQRIAESSLATPGPDSGSVQLSGLDNLERALRKALDSEVSALESRLGFLATTGSTAPFIGLLGTVVGIMSSFTQIGATGSASLAVVAPGIAEALFSTAIGLFAAIPAVVGYNFFIGRVRKMEIELSNFEADLLNIAKRNFFRDR